MQRKKGIKTKQFKNCFIIRLVDLHHTAGKDMVTGLFTFNSCTKMLLKKKTSTYVNSTAELEDHLFQGVSSSFNPIYPPFLLLSQFEFANDLHESLMREDYMLIIFPKQQL